MRILLTIICLAFCASLQAEMKVLAISGSTREGSYNRKLINVAVQEARKLGAAVKVIDLKDLQLPLYDGDLEKEHGLPAKAKFLRDQMIASDAIIISTPEYNGSISGVLKNAIDWTSRDEKGKGSRACYKGKKFALMSAAAGSNGGKDALVHLTDIIENIGGEVLPLQLSVPSCYDAFDDKGELKSAELRAALHAELASLIQEGK